MAIKTEGQRLESVERHLPEFSQRLLRLTGEVEALKVLVTGATKAPVNMKVSELQALAGTLGIEKPEEMTRAELLVAIKAKQTEAKTAVPATE